MISIENITIARGGKNLLRNTSFHIARSEKVVITGASGCGKTSLLLTIMGITSPAEGEITLNGERVSLDGIRQTAAFIGQEPILGANSVQDALMLPFSFKVNKGNTPSQDEINTILAKVRLPAEITEKQSAKVSAGEKQRIAIARALLMGKNLFLIDEITSALDPKSKKAVADVLLSDDFTVLSVSHDDYWINRCETQLELKNHDIRKRC